MKHNRPTGSTIKLRNFSRSLIFIVKYHLRTNSRLDVTCQALAAWCLHFPVRYQKFIWKSIGLSSVVLRKERLEIVRKSINSLAKKLKQKNALCFFIKGDGSPLGRAYESLGGDAYYVDIRRDRLPGDSQFTYLALFSFVNDAALAAKGNWERFLQLYSRRLFRSKTLRTFIKDLTPMISSLRPVIELAHSKKQCIIFVDSGLQGTFALLIRALVQRHYRLSIKQVDIRLLVVYPWLNKLFRGRYLSTRASILTTLEKRRAALS